MKISKELVQELSQMIMTAVPRSKLEQGIVAYIDQGFNERRFLWDCLWAVPNEAAKPWFGKVYSLDCNDDHITTALKTWFKSTGLTYTKAQA
jgi:hypothetical protein